MATSPIALTLAVGFVAFMLFVINETLCEIRDELRKLRAPSPEPSPR